MTAISLLALLFMIMGATLVQALSLRGASRRYGQNHDLRGSNSTITECPIPASIDVACPRNTPIDPVSCIRRNHENNNNQVCKYNHLCDAKSAGFLSSECEQTTNSNATTTTTNTSSTTTTTRSRSLDEDEDAQLKEQLQMANSLLKQLDLNDEEQMQELFLKYNVKEEDIPYVKNLAKILQDEDKVTLSAMSSTPGGEAVFCDMPLVLVPLATPGMGNAWQISDIVVGIGGGIGIEFGAKWGQLRMRADFYRTSTVVQYELNSFSFIVGYTNINLFMGGDWVGTYHAGGVGVGSTFAAGAAFFCKEPGLDPLGCMNQ